MKRIIIFASGSGSNAENLILKLSNGNFKINWHVFTNNSKAGVVKRCENLNIKCNIFDKQTFTNTLIIHNEILKINPDIIVLAGFLLKIPANFINLKFPIINIHPSLLPKYGGKGMYGINIHNAVIEDNEKVSGITVHMVNNNYDEGEIIFQKLINLHENENATSLGVKIHNLEMKYFPEVITRLIS
jgi:phosphoribosylglycinamide formyltransferase-1